MINPAIKLPEPLSLGLIKPRFHQSVTKPNAIRRKTFRIVNYLNQII